MAKTSLVNVTYYNKTIKNQPLQVLRLALSIHGWIIFQSRNLSTTFNFNRTWAEFSNGFGETTSDNFYLGNELLSQLTSARPYSLRVEFLSNGAWYSAEYLRVTVNNSSLGYALYVAGYSGDAGDSLSSSNGLRFSTYDASASVDGSASSKCYSIMSGWWYNCTTPMSNLNNPFKGILWNTLKAAQSNGLAITYTRMMIRPRDV